MALDYALGRTRMDEVELHGVRSLKSGRFTITALTIDGQLLMPTREFWDDLFQRYKLTSGWAERKSYARRFEWLAAHHGSDEIPYRVVWDESGNAWVAPSRRRKIRPGKPTTALPLEWSSSSERSATSCAADLQDSRCAGRLGQKDRRTLLTKQDDSEAVDSDAAEADRQNREWLSRRRRSRGRQSKHGSSAAGHSRLSNFFRGGRG